MSEEIENKKTKGIFKFIKNIIITLIFASLIVFIISIAPNYERDENKGKIALVINYNNVTKSLKSDIYIDSNNSVYISLKDMENFFDGTIYYDEQYKQIITTSDTKVMALPINNKQIEINGVRQRIKSSAEEKEVQGEKQYYIPISELQDEFNLEMKYIEQTNTVTIESLDRECKTANSINNNSVKYLATPFSKTVDKIDEGETVILVPQKNNENNNGYKKIMTDTGKIGYVKEDTLSSENIKRESAKKEKQIEGPISLVWEYFSELGQAPNMTGKTLEGVNVVSPTFYHLTKGGKGELDENVGVAGKSYINWAQRNNYKVWALVSNSSLQDTTHEILNDYKLRENLINNILDATEENNFDGINLDFENMLEEDKDVYSRLVAELAPRLREQGKVLSIDVTAPDGSANWSLCYDRKTLGKVADYLVFMAYDQYGISSKTPGTTAGYNWVENSLNKFIDENREDVDEDKIILAVPFYTRLWREENGEIKSGVLSLKNMDERLPDNIQKTWNEDLKQYYSKFEQDGKIYEIWIEDEKSLTEKLGLIKKYNLAGAAYWRRGMEYEEIWQTISNIVFGEE